ncbi:hypothetical protein [Paraburkholderia sp. J69-1]|uniref:hypothetical protein n=1 Tax=Paraburkholderia sp. J69-1 TaxID=2805436 RepID=UPI002AB6A345|nr:hypothetical protein [Paraburkholderia sp. J69-1]
MGGADLSARASPKTVNDLRERRTARRARGAFTPGFSAWIFKARLTACRSDVYLTLFGHESDGYPMQIGPSFTRRVFRSGARDARQCDDEARTHPAHEYLNSPETMFP